jgi:putative ABC transport system permease protein
MLKRFRFGARSARHRDRADEIHAHIELQIEELVGRGVPADEARRQARLMFGNPRAKLEEVDTLDRIPMIETLLRDLRSAYRSLRAAPGFTAAAVAVLTLAMGAGTAVFSVVDAVALRGLPFDDGERIVRIIGKEKDRVVVGPFAASELLAYREQAHIFESLAAVAYGDITLRRDGAMEPEVLRGQRVTAEFFSVLRVTPARGRAFTSESEIEGNPRVAVISHELWQRRFGGATDVIGRRLPAVGGDVEIIGVMPRGFGYPIGATEPTEVWTPYVIPAKERATKFTLYLTLIARLKEGVSIENTQQQLDAITESRTSSGALMGWDRRPFAVNLQESLVGDHRSWMLMLLASAACVLLIACVNIANLLLVRATVRVRELSVRAALGATRWALTRMLLVESLLLSTIGAGFGTLVAWWSMEGLRALLPPDLPRLANIAMDWRVLGASAAIAAVTGIAFGLAPIFYSSKAIDQTLRQNGRSETPSQRRQSLRTALLVTEVAITVVLLVGASLFLTSLTTSRSPSGSVQHRSTFRAASCNQDSLAA